MTEVPKQAASETAIQAVRSSQLWRQLDNEAARRAAETAAAEYASGAVTIQATREAAEAARLSASIAEARLGGMCLAALARGRGVTKIAREAGVATNTVYRWRDGRTDQ